MLGTTATTALSGSVLHGRGVLQEIYVVGAAHNGWAKLEVEVEIVGVEPINDSLQLDGFLLLVIGLLLPLSAGGLSMSSSSPEEEEESFAFEASPLVLAAFLANEAALWA